MVHFLDIFQYQETLTFESIYKELASLRNILCGFFAGQVLAHYPMGSFHIKYLAAHQASL